jgi:hypothetical protein
METIGMPKEIEDLKGFEVEDNKRLGQEHTYWNLPIRKKEE